MKLEHERIPRTSVVAPFRNEKENLAPLLRETKAALDAVGHAYEILLVDDASNDGGEDSIPKEARIRVIPLTEPAGQSAAMWRGIKEAAGAWIVTIDADLQNDPVDIPAMLELARSGDYDLVCGWRQKVQENALRRFSSCLANRIRRGLLGDPAHDSGCTLKVMKASFAKRLPNWDGMHRFIPTYAAIWGLRQTEMPVQHRARLHGRSKTRQFSRACKAARDLFRMIGEKRRAARKGAVV
jgi:dolichol-phosphate mannosyltransferase